jgi:hypothetical protein
MAFLEKLTFYYVGNDDFFGFLSFFFVIFWSFLSILAPPSGIGHLGITFWGHFLDPFNEGFPRFLGQKRVQKWPKIGHFGPLFGPLFDPLLSFLWRVINEGDLYVPIDIQSGQEGVKKWSKSGQKPGFWGSAIFGGCHFFGGVQKMGHFLGVTFLTTF